MCLMRGRSTPSRALPAWQKRYLTEPPSGGPRWELLRTIHSWAQDGLTASGSLGVAWLGAAACLRRVYSALVHQQGQEGAMQASPSDTCCQMPGHDCWPI